MPFNCAANKAKAKAQAQSAAKPRVVYVPISSERSEKGVSAGEAEKESVRSDRVEMRGGDVKR